MTFGNDLLAEARALAAAMTNNPIRCRTVIGRSYYSAFHELLALAAGQGFVSRKRGFVGWDAT